METTDERPDLYYLDPNFHKVLPDFLWANGEKVKTEGAREKWKGRRKTRKSAGSRTKWYFSLSGVRIVRVKFRVVFWHEVVWRKDKEFNTKVFLTTFSNIWWKVQIREFNTDALKEIHVRWVEQREHVSVPAFLFLVFYLFIYF
jgi:hypothetical protein